MIASQRKAHQVIWILLTVFMVAFLCFTLPRLDLSASPKAIPKEPVVATLEGNMMTITVNTPLKSASSLIYALTADGKTGSILGQITTTGTYTFKVPNTTQGIIIMDKIKNTELFKTTF